LSKRSGWELIAQSLNSADADVMVVQAGRRWEESRNPAYGEARELHAQGYTLLVRHAERHDAELANIAMGFANDFLGPVDVHLYATPKESFGFGWHYDVEDVFILQLEGVKEYSLRKNTVNPWPVLDNMPQDLRYEREIMPMLKCELAAGDWLYIPHGYWHKADAKSDSISLAVGIMTTTALDVLDFARQRLRESIRWRQRLPILTEESRPSMEAHFAELGEELKTLFCDPAFVRQVLNSREP
jgi:ribosomal protein L16 Arg81 hydroxylase